MLDSLSNTKIQTAFEKSWEYWYDIWYCWWKKSPTTTWDVYNPIDNGIYYHINWWVYRISEPSTAVWNSHFVFGNFPKRFGHTTEDSTSSFLGSKVRWGSESGPNERFQKFNGRKLPVLPFDKLDIFWEWWYQTMCMTCVTCWSLMKENKFLRVYYESNWWR